MTKSIRSVVFLCLLFFFSNASSQDKLPIKFGKVVVQDFDIRSSLIDSNTNAVVIAEKGNSEFVANPTEFTFSLVHKKQRRVKLITKNGFNAATVTIPLYVSAGGKAERLEDLDAFTYILQDGKVVAVKVDKGSIYTEKVNKNWILKKFTFPAIQEGSIIEYSYEIKSDFFFNLQSWTFQDEYPVLWSQYDAGIPEFFKFIILSQGYQSYVVNKVDKSQTSFTFIERQERQSGTFGSPASGNNMVKIDGWIDYHTWIMKDIPGLKEEPFTTTINNSLAKIEFQLKEIAYPNSLPRPVMSTWEKVAESLMEDEDFGIAINRPNNWLDDVVAPVIAGATTSTEKIKRIYEYVRDNFTCTNYSRYSITTSLKDVVKNKNGSVADMNMLLIAMLKTLRIETYPVILSTRSHGFANEVYPLMDRYNYVIAYVKDGSNEYFLDAATPRLCFNKLPLQVYNGQARVIKRDEGIPVYFAADSLTESSSTAVFITNAAGGKLEGAYNSNYGYYGSLRLRNKIGASGMEDYKKEFKTDWPEDVEISGLEVDSLKKYDDPVAVKCDFKLSGFGDADVVYFNPMLNEAVKKNPFTAAERFYPVEMPYTFSEVYTLNMEIPSGYKIEELPKSARIMLNEDEGMFEYLISADESTIQMRCRLVIKRANFLKEDYQTLRDFYGFLVKKEAEQIVFKKNK